jgi:hypothetical protein
MIESTERDNPDATYRVIPYAGKWAVQRWVEDEYRPGWRNAFIGTEDEARAMVPKLVGVYFDAAGREIT